MSTRHQVLIAALALGLAFAGPAGAARYAGSISDAEARVSSAKVTTRGSGASLRSTIRCKPKKGCPLAKRTRVVLDATGDQYEYRGTFTLHGSACQMSAFIYPGAFQGSFTCGDGTAGAVSASEGHSGGGGGGGGGNGDGGGDYRPPRR